MQPNPLRLRTPSGISLELLNTQTVVVARDSLPGAVLKGRYHIDELLAEGGMGCVYRAYDAEQDCFVAVKVLQAYAAVDVGMRRRFLHEARTTMAIDSEHVVRITDLGELDDGSAFYVMDFLEGVTLDELRVDTLETVKEIALQLCAGLAAAHRHGVVHRDLKPENIIVTEGPNGALHCRLIDFGIAKLPFATMLTMPGQVLGTPAYIAPEQCKAGSDIDNRCDIYALGVVLYELVCGELPFDDVDPIRVALAHLAAPPPPLASREPNCPPDLNRLIMRCLSKRPEDRVRDAATLAMEIEAMSLTGVLGIEETPEVSTVLLAEDPGFDYANRVDPRTVPISMSDLLGYRAKKLTPPAPQPWMTPLPDSGATYFVKESPDWLLWSVVTAAAILALAAISAASMM